MTTFEQSPTPEAKNGMSGFVVVLEMDRAEVGREMVAGLLRFLDDLAPGSSELRACGKAAIARWGRSTSLASTSRPDGSGVQDNAFDLVLAGTLFGPADLEEDDAARWLAGQYARHGAAGLREANGQFAAVFWNERSGELCAAGDQIGLAQLYYWRNDSRLICATDARSILELPGVRREPDPIAIADYTFRGAPLGGRTFFSGIRRLAPGHTLTWRGGILDVEPYWEPDFRYQYGRTDEDLTEELIELLEDSLRLRTRGEVSVGCQLSGGLDSSVVLGLAARQGVDLRAFSIAFENGGVYDESRYARLAADHFGVPLEVAFPRASDLRSTLPGLIAADEAPLADTSAFSYHAATRLAATRSEVVLAGHGGDEVFGGYRAQFVVGFGSAPWFATSPATPPPGVPLGARLGRALRRGGIRGLLRRIAARGRLHPETPEDLWVQLHCSQQPVVNPVLSPRFIRSLGGYSPRDAYLADFVNAPSEHLFDRCIHHDLRCYLPVLLDQGSAVARAVGVECRTPILDYRIVDFATRIPPEQRVRGLVPKYLLRRAASWLPREITERRDKLGFPVPTDEWLTGELEPWARSIILDPRTLDRGILDPDELRGGTLNPNGVWDAISIELWFRIFVDRDREWLERARAIEAGTPDFTPQPIPSAP